jgi:DNA polymerase I-like protein with 3'-5' exonuclease and polymerase domains
MDSVIKTYVDSEPSAVTLAKSLELHSLAIGTPVAVDTETVRCNPKKESPVGRAELFCMTTAYRAGLDTINAAYVPGRFLSYFKEWLEDDYEKCGSGIMDYDYHVFANLGVHLRNVVGDTRRMSQLLNPSKMFGHGLKQWGERLGFTSHPFSTLQRQVASKGKPRTYKRDNDALGRVAGAEFQDIDLSKFTTTLELDEIWRDYPQRRQMIMDYAIQDPVMSLVVFEHLVTKLKQVNWS